MTKYEDIVAAAGKGFFGGFVSTDGDWCATRTPVEFKAYFEAIVPENVYVVEFGSKSYSTAYVKLDNGIVCMWNGRCHDSLFREKNGWVQERG